jgi:hypothetical protein
MTNYTSRQSYQSYWDDEDATGNILNDKQYYTIPNNIPNDYRQRQVHYVYDNNKKQQPERNHPGRYRQDKHKDEDNSRSCEIDFEWKEVKPHRSKYRCKAANGLYYNEIHYFPVPFYCNSKKNMKKMYKRANCC